jgi:twinkle protein
VRARRNSAPVLEDIAGAKHWDNVGSRVTVHGPLLYEKGAIKTQTAYHRKARFEELGHPCKLSLDFKIKEGKYVSVDYDV